MPRVKKYSCHGRKCKLDLSMIDLTAKEIIFEVGSNDISMLDPSATETGVEAGVNVMHYETFTSTGKSMKKGHWNGESGFSYLNLLKQGTGPSGINLWFGTMYDSQNDIYYDISPDANGTSIITNATRGSELPLPMGIKVPVSNNSTIFSNTSTSVAYANGHRQLVDDGSVIDIMVVWTLGAECRASGLNTGCAVTSQTETNMRGKIDAMIAGNNQIYRNSGILTQLRLVYAYRHPTYTWDYQNKCHDALDQLKNTNDGQLDDVHSYRSQYRADIVQMIHAPCDYCGLGFIGVHISLAFSVITSDCLNEFTSVHELGHNMVR